MSGREIKVYPSPSALTEAAAEMFLQAAETAISARGVFTVALSGGHTPQALFEMLAEGELQRQIDWPKVHVFWVDERPVPPSHPDSNFKLADDALFSELGKKPAGLHRVPTELKDPEKVAAAYEQDLKRTFRELGQSGPWPCFDFVLLGMGDDGHTASLMPDGEGKAGAQGWVDFPWVPHLNSFRFTLSAAVLNHARAAIFLVEGAGKAEILARVLEGPRDPRRLPSQRIELKEGRLTWLLDQAAAGKLTPLRD